MNTVTRFTLVDCSFVAAYMLHQNDTAGMIATNGYAALNESDRLWAVLRQQQIIGNANRLMSVVPLYLFFIGIMACQPDNEMPLNTTHTDTSLTDTAGSRLLIRIGQRTFTVTLLTNATATAFQARLPLTVPMRELNGNEKYGELTPGLPATAVNPGAIQPGDLMLYGSGTLVLFYEAFQTTYRYTKIGRIDNPAGLATALGTGSVTISFERTN